MAGDIRNLSAICATIRVVILRIRAVERLLPSIAAMKRECVFVGEQQTNVGCYFSAQNFYITEIHHHPSVLTVALGDGYNFVFYLIEIHIRFGAKPDALKASYLAISGAEKA